MVTSVPVSGCASGLSSWKPTHTRAHSMTIEPAFAGTLQDLFDLVLARKGAERGLAVELQFVVRTGTLYLDSPGTYEFGITASVGVVPKYNYRHEGVEIDMMQKIRLSSTAAVDLHVRFVGPEG